MSFLVETPGKGPLVQNGIIRKALYASICFLNSALWLALFIAVARSG